MLQIEPLFFPALLFHAIKFIIYYSDIQTALGLKNPSEMDFLNEISYITERDENLL